jgi:tetratricopeptide (TPR) repeat protein
MIHLLTLSIAIILASLSAVTSFADSEALSSSNACEKNESWSGQGALPKSVVDYLSKMLDADITPELGLARAYDLEKSTSAEARLLGYYMEGRAFLMSGLEDNALESFSFVATSEPTNATAKEIQFASLECIARTLRANSGMAVPPIVASHLKSLLQLANSANRKQIPFEIALDVLLEQIGSDAADFRDPLEALSGSGAYENIGRAFVAAQHRDHLQVIANLSPLFASSKHTSLPEGLRHEETRARLLLARSYYATQQFNDAIAQYLKINHRSNEISEVLSELSWSYLQLKRYGDAVGTAVNLRLGEMRSTFAPESLEVAAMSLNELGQIKDSLRTLKTLEQDYLPSYQWLKTRGTQTSPSLYSLAIAYLKSDGSNGVPSKVANEWVRAPLFLAGQSEIHRLFGVKDRYVSFVNSMKDELSRANSDDQESLRRAALALEEHQAPAFEAADHARIQWVDRINQELTRRNARMLATLDDVRENSRMVKIEIFNGASHDMIWLRHHPEFKEGSSKYLSEKNSPSGSEVWNWGKVDMNADHAEVWEDELGAFRAHLQDHCADKNRYLGVSASSH